MITYIHTVTYMYRKCERAHPSGYQWLPLKGAVGRERVVERYFLLAYI